MPPPKYIRQLQRLIRDTHGCNARHFTTIPVTEIARGKVAWQGDVEVFDVRGHPAAQTCYAWMDNEGGGAQVMAVLGIPPVNSAEAAVKLAIAAKSKRAK